MPSAGAPAGAYVENLVFPALGITLTSTDPNDPAVVATTIIDGAATDSVVTFDIGAPAAALLTGLTLRNGSSVAGGGINMVNGSPTVRKCVITGNTATDGGGIRVWNGSPNIEQCTITLNTADSGGGILAMGYTAGAQTITVADCTISDNSAIADWANGGGIYCDCLDLIVSGGMISDNTTGQVASSGASGGGIAASDAALSLAGCTVTNNTAQGGQAYGGGVYALMCSIALDGCTITDNDVAGIDFCAGGGIAADWGSDLTVTDCPITGNSATGGWSYYDGGGGISAWLSELAVERCTIAGNHADESGGAILSYESTSTTVTNCTVAGNSSAGGAGITCILGPLAMRDCRMTGNVADVDGGGVYIENAAATVRNCTIAMNEASTLYGAGGGVAAFSTTLTLDNNIMWGGVGVFGPDLYVDSWDPNDASQADVSYCDLAGGQAAVYVGDSSTLNWLAGNIDSDPTFVDTDGVDNDQGTWSDNNFHLDINSPCINTGNPAFTPLPGETDIDGQARVQRCLVDMGADEADVTPAPTGDADSDGDADVLDFVDIQRCCGTSLDSDCLGTFDFDESCTIDGADLAPFEALFTGSGT